MRWARSDINRFANATRGERLCGPWPPKRTGGEFVGGIFDGRNLVDGLHANGRCTCWGEGRCALCLDQRLMSEPQPLERRENMNATETVRAAIANTDSDYWTKLCRTRAEMIPGAIEDMPLLNPDREGSFFADATPADVDALMREAEWIEYEHEAVQRPARAFRADITGRVGMVPMMAVIESVGPLEWRDPKGTGKVECTWVLPATEHAKRLRRVEHTFIIIGPSHAEMPCVWTFHPGEPVTPSRVERYPSGLPEHDRHGQRVTWEAARRCGAEWAKLA